MFRYFLIIASIWAIFILVMSAIPGSSLPKSPLLPHFDKIVHAALYFILSIFLIPAFDHSIHRFFRKTAPILVIIIVAIFGGIIEIAQENWFLKRSGDIADLLSDLAGALLAIIVYYFLAKAFLVRFLEKRKN